MRRTAVLVVIGVVVAVAQFFAAQPAMHLPGPGDPIYGLKIIGAIALFWAGLWISWLVALALCQVDRWVAWSFILTVLEAIALYVGLRYLDFLGDVRPGLLAAAIIAGMVFAGSQPHGGSAPNQNPPPDNKP